MTLPLMYLRRPDRCPLPLTRVAFLIGLAYAYSEQLHEQLTQEWISARTWALECQNQIESGELSPLRPYTKDTVFQELFGELVEVPRELGNPKIYEWGRAGVVTKMPWFLKALSDASAAQERANALAVFRVILERRAKEEGFTGDYDAPLLWMLFGNRCTDEARFPKVSGARGLVSAMGDIELVAYLMDAEMHQVHDAVEIVIHGIRYQNQKKVGYGTHDV